MSADLLRRAAEKLREHAGAATQWSPAPWRHAAGLPSDSVRTEAGWEVLSSTYVTASADLAKYAALMHPPVALALAELLERIWVLPQLMVLPSIKEYAEGMARAILREES